jgi:hypothetical protein
MGTVVASRSTLPRGFSSAFSCLRGGREGFASLELVASRLRCVHIKRFQLTICARDKVAFSAYARVAPPSHPPIAAERRRAQFYDAGKVVMAPCPDGCALFTGPGPLRRWRGQATFVQAEHARSRKRGPPVRDYTCAGCAQKGKTACSGRSVPMAALDAAVLEHLADKLLTPDRLTMILEAFIAHSASTADSRKEQLAQAKRMLTEAGGRIDRLLQMVEQGLMSVDDPALKERLDTAKVARVAASERVRMLDRPNEAGTSQITPDKINKLSVVLREALKSSDIGFRKAYLRLSLDRVVVADDEIRLRGPTIALAKAAAAGGLPATAGLVPSFVQEWRPVRDSNPCYQRERLVSWASRRTGRWAAWVAFPQAGVKARFAQGSVA